MSTAGEKISVVCPTCHKRLLVSAASLGKQARCPACKGVFPLEQIYEAETVPTPPPPAPDFGNGYAPTNNAWGAPQPAYPQQQPAAPTDSYGAPANPYGDNAYGGPNNFATLSDPYAAPQVNSGPSYSSSSYKPKPKAQFWDSSVLGGLALMGIAIVWFFGGLMINIIYIYPPILFIIGLVVMIKGLASGSIAGRYRGALTGD